MNKVDLVNSIAEKTGFTKKDSGKALEAFIESIQEALSNKDKVQLVGFGTFGTRVSKGRNGVCKLDVAKGKEWKTEDSIKPTFKAGKGLKNSVK